MSALFKLSEGVNLGLHAMMKMALTPTVPCDTAGIAAALGASAHHLAKILQRLQRAGFIASVRGPKGGFLLARDPKTIHLLEIYEEIEGPVEIRYCLFDTPRCKSKSCCGVGEFIGQAGEEFRQLLAKSTLAEVAAKFHGVDATTMEV